MNSQTVTNVISLCESKSSKRGPVREGIKVMTYTCGHVFVLGWRAPAPPVCPQCPVNKPTRVLSVE